MRPHAGPTLAGALILAASAATAAPPAIVTQGKGAATACATCHGADGLGNAQAGFPMLAQLPPAYLAKQIADFKAGTRSNPVMSPIAAALTPEDIEASARYYASLPRPAAHDTGADPATVDRGRKLAIDGAWDRNVPPCFKCHAVDGGGVPPNFPPIAGQHASYTVSQLQAWKSGARSNDPQKLMKTVAQNLSDEDIRAVAAYLATLGNRGAKK
ncbi:cytochrome c-type protein [Thiobacillus denitrificans ATCC 25259]|uniref:Cytochrome c-type protein n=1 Tax=Thiobacillus denitrificans (strain ATCC 25259 / T1) TaxID=292415 RepID=Q3SMG3_THIDA|nr:c-type cytochrome [Thiobacillus denitrificans]AAZ96082.1 cytochrome c-type protein [Thiobacillus denitrificans ATCC 25259]